MSINNHDQAKISHIVYNIFLTEITNKHVSHVIYREKKRLQINAFDFNESERFTILSFIL